MYFRSVLILPKSFSEHYTTINAFVTQLWSIFCYRWANCAYGLLTFDLDRAESIRINAHC